MKYEIIPKFFLISSLVEINYNAKLYKKLGALRDGIIICKNRY